MSPEIYYDNYDMSLCELPPQQESPKTRVPQQESPPQQESQSLDPSVRRLMQMAPDSKKIDFFWTRSSGFSKRGLPEALQLQSSERKGGFTDAVAHFERGSRGKIR